MRRDSIDYLQEEILELTTKWGQRNCYVSGLKRKLIEIASFKKGDV